MDNNLISTTLYCPNNSQCIYSGEDYFYINAKIINSSDYNLEIPLKAIKSFWTFTDFQNIKTRKSLGKLSPPGMYIPQFAKDLTLLPAHGEIIIERKYRQEDIREAFHDAQEKTFLYTSEINTPVYY